MKLFECQHCGQLLYFENVLCERCGHATGYLAELETLSAVEADGAVWMALAQPRKRYRFCANWELRACNWLVEVAEIEPPAFCLACSHNSTVPDIADPQKHMLWVRLETAKRRLIYSLIKLRLPLPLPGGSQTEQLVFNFLADTPTTKVMTGHHNGTITISLNEADDGYRERTRTSMFEPYRTLLGHFRHEIGHFYWDKLVRDRGKLDGFRGVFGDERTDYKQALDRYYADGPAAGWPASFISAYASMHPWEDFAESWAHYLHIVDTLEMAYAFGLRIAPRVSSTAASAIAIDQNAYHLQSAQALIDAWLPVVFAVNSLNRTMGQPDLYPFVISEPVIAKLEYVRSLIAQAA